MRIPCLTSPANRWSKPFDDLRRRCQAALLPRHPRRPRAGRPARTRLQFELRDRKLSWIYFSATLDAAIWGCELAKGEGRERIYIVEPTGPFEDDPNLTDKKFPGNPTRSYRSRQPLRIVGEVPEWEGHPPERLREMKDALARMEAEGGAEIID